MLWLLKLLNPLVLEIREGKVSVAKGRVPSGTLSEIQGVIPEGGTRRGTIHADGAGRFHFSSWFPVDRRQPLRNILASL